MDASLTKIKKKTSTEILLLQSLATCTPEYFENVLYEQKGGDVCI